MSEDPGTRRMRVPAAQDEPDTAVPAEPRSAQDSSPGTAVLVLTRGPQAGRQIKLERSQMKLGRSTGCDIVLEDATVSRQHAEIKKESGQYVITDAGSLNGTYVNRTPLDRETVLNDGDELRIGIFRLLFRA